MTDDRSPMTVRNPSFMVNALVPSAPEMGRKSVTSESPLSRRSSVIGGRTSGLNRVGKGYKLVAMTTQQDIYVCDVCGAEMLEIHCKIICPRCGFMRDCSDP